MLGYSFINVFPKKLRDDETVKKVASLVDWLLSNDFTNADKLSKRY